MSFGTPPVVVDHTFAARGGVSDVYPGMHTATHGVGIAGGYGGGVSPLLGGACCEVGGASCGTGGVSSGTTMSFVGEGCGDYVAVPVRDCRYVYVGRGAGTFTMVPIAAGCGGWGWLLCCLLPLLLLICCFCLPGTTTTTTTTSWRPPTTTIPPFPTWTATTRTTTTPDEDVITTTTTTQRVTRTVPVTTPVLTTTPMETTTSTTTTTTPTSTTPPTCGVCKVYGDPHVTTFDGSHASFYSQGEYWIFKSSEVWIQGRYKPTPVTNGLSVMKEIAIGGPFLNGEGGSKNILRISALGATLNGVAISLGFPGAWQNENPMIKITADGNGQEMQASRAGKPLHVVHVDLPLFVHLDINRWNEPGEGDYINAMIRMQPPGPAQDGHCGNFNGVAEDDTRPAIRARVGTMGVTENLLFNTKTPVTVANRPDLNNCPTDKTEQARAICAAKAKNGMASHDCMVDVCFGGAHFAELTDYD